MISSYTHHASAVRTVGCLSTALPLLRVSEPVRRHAHRCAHPSTYGGIKVHRVRRSPCARPSWVPSLCWDEHAVGDGMIKENDLPDIADGPQLNLWASSYLIAYIRRGYMDVRV
jgi:hypothetical protein